MVDIKVIFTIVMTKEIVLVLIFSPSDTCEAATAKEHEDEQNKKQEEHRVVLCKEQESIVDILCLKASCISVFWEDLPLLVCVIIVLHFREVNFVGIQSSLVFYNQLSDQLWQILVNLNMFLSSNIFNTWVRKIDVHSDQFSNKSVGLTPNVRILDVVQLIIIKL